MTTVEFYKNSEELKEKFSASRATLTAPFFDNNVDLGTLVAEPYVNPFRVYSLELDYTRLKQMIANGVECCILNIGDFMDTKVQPKHTLGIIEAVVDGKAKFEKWENFSDIQIMHAGDLDTSFENTAYAEQFTKRMQDRVDFVKSRETEKAGLDKLPQDAIGAFENAIKQMKGKAA